MADPIRSMSPVTSTKFPESPRTTTNTTPTLSPAPSAISIHHTPPLSDQHLEERLFRHFKVYTWSERDSSKSSWAWAHGYDIQNDTERRWVCRLCIYKRNPQHGSCKASGIQNAGNHLFTHHGIPAPGGEAQSRAEKTATKAGQKTILKSVASHLGLDRSSPREQAITNTYIKSFDENHFHRLLVEWIVTENLPFNAVESGKLRAIFDYLHPSVSISKANLSHTAITTKIVKEYERHRNTIVQVLAKSPGLIHISFDGWTTRNKHALYGIACFFRDDNSNLHKIVIGVPEVSGRHFGHNIGGEILDILREYQIDLGLV